MLNLPLPMLIFFVIIYCVCIFSIIRPDIVVNLTAKYFKFSAKIFGSDKDIQITNKAKSVVRVWNIFIIILITFFLFTNKF